MKSARNIRVLLGAIACLLPFSVGVIGGFFYGYKAGHDAGYDESRKFQRDIAIRKGFASYQANPTTGEVDFIWRTNQ